MNVGKLFILACIMLLPGMLRAELSLSVAQKGRAEAAVKSYFNLLAQYAQQPFGADASNIRDSIIFMCENLYNTPIYNDLQSLSKITNLGTSCTIDDYLLSLGLLNDVDSYVFQITHDSIMCQPLLEPSYTEGYDDLNALVYVKKRIEGEDFLEELTNVVRFNLNTNKISYIEKASFSTDDEDINFILRNHYGYSTSKLNELAGRCYKEKKFENAFLLYETAAKRNDSNSQYELCYMLSKRLGCSEYGELAISHMMTFWLSKLYARINMDELKGGLEEKIIRFKEKTYGKHFSEDFVLPQGNEPFNDGLMCIFDKEKRKTGYIDRLGNLVIPLEYITFWNFSEGLVSICNNAKKYGFMNNRGEAVIPFVYDLAYPFYNNAAIVMQKDGEGKKRYFLIDKYNKKISEEFDYMAPSLYCQMILAGRGGKIGFVNREGELKVPFIYDDCLFSDLYKCSSDDYKYCAVKRNGKWGYVNLNTFDARLVIPCKFEKIKGFYYGMAAVYDGYLWSYIDYKGNEMGTEKYSSCSNFQANGLALVQDYLFSEYYIINKYGKALYQCDVWDGVPYNIRKL